MPARHNTLAEGWTQELHRVAVRRQLQQRVVDCHALVCVEVGQRHLVLCCRERQPQLSFLRRTEDRVLHAIAKQPQLPDQLATVQPESVEGANLDQSISRAPR
jgi:hypothetical protein